MILRVIERLMHLYADRLENALNYERVNRQRSKVKEWSERLFSRQKEVSLILALLMTFDLKTRILWRQVQTHFDNSLGSAVVERRDADGFDVI